jgi:hypothetical protein
MAPGIRGRTLCNLLNSSRMAERVFWWKGVKRKSVWDLSASLAQAYSHPQNTNSKSVTNFTYCIIYIICYVGVFIRIGLLPRSLSPVGDKYLNNDEWTVFLRMKCIYLHRTVNLFGIFQILYMSRGFGLDWLNTRYLLQKIMSSISSVTSFHYICDSPSCICRSLFNWIYNSYLFVMFPSFWRINVRKISWRDQDR